MSTSSLEAAIRILIDTKDGQSQLAALSDAFVKHLQSIGKTAEDFDAIKQLSQDLETGKVQAEECAAEMVQLAGVWKKMSTEAADKDLLGIKSHVEVQRQIEATRAAYDRLKKSGTLTSAELAQAAMKSEERIRELKHQTNGWIDSLGKAKTALGGVVGAFAGMAKVTGDAVQFEAAMADVAKVVDGTEEQMQHLTARIKDMTRTLPLAASELAHIAAAGGQLGVPIEKLETFVRLAAKMSTAFGMSAEEAGQAVAKLTNIFGLPIEQVEKLGDAINTLGNTTAATESSIVEVLTRIGGTAKQFGLSAEQASALASTMLSMGVSAQVAGTGINAILNKLQTATIQGKEYVPPRSRPSLTSTSPLARLPAPKGKAMLCLSASVHPRGLRTPPVGFADSPL
ncbi:MAG: phage tail tape measure protein [Rhodocyclaceae bacterium]|nr:phage tail tape measure protein [Rhodocyclaceae bacterium]